MSAIAIEVPVPRIDPRILGNKAIWVGIFAECTEFALIFFVYFIARAHHSEVFHDGPEQLLTLAGVVNIVIMLTSSFFVARAALAIRRDTQRTCLHWLVAGLVTGLGYPVVKFMEVRWNLSQGLDGSGDVFQLAYYYLTFNHLVHVSWGLLGLIWILFRTWTGGYSARDHRGLIAFASYWHATDLIWLMIFPLFCIRSQLSRVCEAILRAVNLDAGFSRPTAQGMQKSPDLRFTSFYTR